MMNTILSWIIIIFVPGMLSVIYWAVTDRYFPFLKPQCPDEKSMSARSYAKAQIYDDFRMMFFAICFAGFFYFGAWIPFDLGLTTTDPMSFFKVLFYIFIIAFVGKLLLDGACLLKAYITESDSGD
jgi:hypothetical protein